MPTPGTRMGVGRELVLGPGLSWNCHFPNPPRHPEMASADPLGAPLYGGMPPGPGDRVAVSRACACALGPAIGRAGAQGAHGRGHASVTALAVPSSPGCRPCLVHGPQDQASGPLRPEGAGPEEHPQAPAGRLAQGGGAEPLGRVTAPPSPPGAAFPSTLIKAAGPVQMCLCGTCRGFASLGC